MLVPAYAATIHKSQGSEYPTVIVPCSLNTSHAAAEPSLHRRDQGKAAADAIVVLHASNLSPLKRPLDLLRAVAPLRTSFPTLVCVVVGDGPLRVRVEEAADNLGLSRVLRFTGWVPHERMPEFITLADLVALPSAAEGLARATHGRTGLGTTKT